MQYSASRPSLEGSISQYALGVGTVLGMEPKYANPVVRFETHPSRYRHWELGFEGPVARLNMAVKDHEGLRSDYVLKLNSYDLGVDVELADAIQRIRFEHPEVKTVVVGSGAGSRVLLGRQHLHVGLQLARLQGELLQVHQRDPALHGGRVAGLGAQVPLRHQRPLRRRRLRAGAGLDEIALVEDGSSAVSLPEVPLLAVLPGTGGLTRLVDKRKVRRDQADVFCTLAEGIKGKRAVEWRLVDHSLPKSRFDAGVAERARALAEGSDRPGGAGIALAPLEPRESATEVVYKYVTLTLDAARRIAELTVRGPSDAQPLTPEEFLKAGSSAWSLQAFRELDDAILRLRVNHPQIGMVILKTVGDPAAVLAADASLHKNKSHWLVREILLHQKRVLKRVDLTAKTFYAFVEKGSCFAGSLAELLWAADRSYMLDIDEGPRIGLSPLNAGALPMSNGLTRLQTRFLGEPGALEKLGFLQTDLFDARQALAAGLVTFAPDEIDWEDEIRLALEERTLAQPRRLDGARVEPALRRAGDHGDQRSSGGSRPGRTGSSSAPAPPEKRGAHPVRQDGIRPEFDLRRT